MTISKNYTYSYNVVPGLFGTSGGLSGLNPGVTVTGISADDVNFVPITSTDTTYAASASVSGNYLIFKANQDGSAQEDVTPTAQVLIDAIQANESAATPLSDSFYYELSDGTTDEVTLTLNDVEISATGPAYKKPEFVQQSSVTNIAGLVIDKALATGQTTDQNETLSVTVSVFDFGPQDSDGSLLIIAGQEGAGAGGVITTTATGPVKSVNIVGSIAQINADLAGLNYSASAVGSDFIEVQAVDGPATTATGLFGKIEITPPIAGDFTFHLPVSPSSSNALTTGFGVTLTGISTDGISFIPVTATDPTYGTSKSVDGTYVSFAANADSTMEFGLTQLPQPVVDAIQANEDSGATTPLTDTFFFEFASGGTTGIDRVNVDLDDVEFNRTGAPFTTPLTLSPGTITNIAGLTVDKALATGQTTDQNETLTVTVSLEDFSTNQSDGSLSIDPTMEGPGAGGVITTGTSSGINSLTITGSIAAINADLQGLSYSSNKVGTDTILVSAIDGPSRTPNGNLGAISIAAPIENTYNDIYNVPLGGFTNTLEGIGAGATVTGISTDDIHFTPVTTTDPSFAASAAVSGNFLTLKANADGSDNFFSETDAQTLIDDIAANESNSTPLTDTFYYKYVSAGTSYVDQVTWTLSDVEFSNAGTPPYTADLGIGLNTSVNIGGITVDKSLATGQTSDAGDILTVTVGILDFGARPQTADGALSLNPAAEGAGAGGDVTIGDVSLGVATGPGSTVTITGSITQIDADLQGLTYTSGATPGNDTLYEQAIDGPTDIPGFAFYAIHSPCYCRGTRILTGRGEVAVEDLVIGDHLVTRLGAMRPLRWIGRRSYSGRFAAANPDVLPVLIRAGALAAGVPARDLCVSSRHAMYFDHVLIPALALVNHVTILRMTAVDEVAYFHLELDSHDVILAEGAESETYLDDNNRNMFQNAADYSGANGNATGAGYCAPREETGVAVARVRATLATRAAELGYRAPRPYPLVLEATGLTRAVIPAGVTELHVLSPINRVPGDGRPLGALLLGVRLDATTMNLRDRWFSRGFHAVEHHGAQPVRWTNGEGVIEIPPCVVDQVIEVEVGALAAERQAA